MFRLSLKFGNDRGISCYPHYLTFTWTMFQQIKILVDLGIKILKNEVY